MLQRIQLIVLVFLTLGRQGAVCPCMLYGHNVERLEEGKTSWREPCIYHAVFVEGGLALAAGTGILHCLQTPLIFEGLICTWMLCSTLTSNYRISLQRKYHLQVNFYPSYYSRTFMCFIENTPLACPYHSYILLSKLLPLCRKQQVSN